MKKSLNGSELAGYIKERQEKSVRNLKQASNVKPKLAIIRTNPDPIVDSYMRLKQGYGKEVGITVDVHTIDQSQAINTIEDLNNDEMVHGIIVQIPLPDPSKTKEILDAVAPEKDVDGLSVNTNFEPATPMAINWLLAGYNIELKNKQILIVGTGKLVGAPLAKEWKQQGLNVEVANLKTRQLKPLTLKANIIVCATGSPGIIKKDMVRPDAVIVDAGVATDKNGLLGDVDPGVRELPRVTITPEKGGVGPLTVCSLFENVIRSAQKTTK